MRRIKLTLAYDGTNFNGWQRQDDQRTVQGTLEAALKEMTSNETNLTVAGRTDAGVHALGQVAHFDTESKLELERFQHGLTYFGQGEISVLNAEEVDEAFHARFAAKSRSYVYKILNREMPCPLRRFTHLHVRRPLDLKAMQTALKPLHGELDCSSFRSSSCQSSTPMCFIEAARIEIVGKDEIHFHITANHFLHNMIRILMGTLIEIGHGERPSDNIKTLLEVADRTQAGITSKPHGLYFSSVSYA